MRVVVVLAEYFNKKLEASRKRGLESEDIFGSGSPSKNL
jgi:hypothetical protein